MDSGHRWWYCLRHHTVEPEQGCPAKDRLGPYSTEEEAAQALGLSRATAYRHWTYARAWVRSEILPEPDRPEN